MNSRTFCLLVLLLPLLASATADAAERPNFVILVADDLGYGDVGYNGSRIDTPNIDRLAERGVRLNQFYAQPVCSPTRAAFLTGDYPFRYGMQVGVVRPWADYGLPLDKTTLPELLQAAGYRTAAIGKWHLGHARRAYLPTSRGFDHHYGCYNGAIGYFTHERDGALDWHRNGNPVREVGYATGLIADEACRVIDEHSSDKPLFLYVPFTAVHTPIQAPEESRAKYSHFKLPHRQTYAAMTAELDRAIGRIMQRLSDSNLDAANTLIVFFSDNGGIPKYGSNGDLRGQKGQLYEGGIRVPALVVWEGVLAGSRVIESPTHVVDWFPTILKLAGATLPNAGVDGKDLMPSLQGGTPDSDRLVVHNVSRAHAAIRIGDFKAIHNGHVNSIQRESDDDRWELFNIANDPSEKNNLAQQMPKRLARFQQAIKKLRTKTAPPLAKVGKPDDFVVPAVWGTAE